jgi:hypothetical protein
MKTNELESKEIFMKDIENLDLSMIKLKLRDSEEGLGWDAEFCDKIEVEYKRYLSLKREYSTLEIVPNKLVDKFWHHHILDTEKYFNDCQEVFGYFVHHYPYFGMKDEEDFQNLCDAFEQTAKLYEYHFSSKYSASSSRCRTACKPVKCK